MNTKAKVVTFVIGCLLFTLWAGIRITASIDFSVNCGGYLTRASNANSITLAEENLTKALIYLEDNNLTSGQVSIFLRQPKNDIGYWYQNLKSAQNQLQSIDADTISDLEESNVLMKLRETLTDSTDNGTSLVHPNGISIYPDNVSLFILCLISSSIIVIFGIWALMDITY